MTKVIPGPRGATIRQAKDDCALVLLENLDAADENERGDDEHDAGRSENLLNDL